MKKLFTLLALTLSLSAFSAVETTFYDGDIITFMSTEDIVIPAEKIEVRTSCGLLLSVTPKSRQRTFKADREFKMKITSTTRFWTRAEIEDGTTMLQKAYFQASSFEKMEELLKDCKELKLISIEAVEEEEEK
jgi:hypothetical protein